MEITAEAQVRGSPATGFAHVPSLDGLRGVAVLSVVAYHAGFGWAGGGFLGVDTFFVLSGYLITSLLRAEQSRTGSVSVTRFWSRRCRRLLPALGFLFVVLIGFAALQPDQPSLTTLRSDMLSGLGYIANWHFIASGSGYFDALAPSPLRHLWSLAIEEQFYVVWPLAFLVLVRLRRPAVGVLSLALVSAATMFFLYEPGNPSRAYFGTDTHAHGLLLGAALAFVTIRASRWLATAGLVAGLGALVCIWRFDGSGGAVYHGQLLAFELMILVVIATCVQGRRSSLQTILSFRPLRAVGLVSYGLYLWHWPVFVLMDERFVGLSGHRLLAIQLVTTTGFTLFSYFVVEMPIRRGFLVGRRALATVSIAIGAGVAALLLVSASLESPIAFALQSRHTQSSLKTTHPGRYRVMLVGDSTASTMAPGIASHAKAAGVQFVDGAKMGCSLDRKAREVRRGSGAWIPLDPRPRCDWKKTWPRLLDRYQPDLVVMMFGPNDLGDHHTGDHLYRYATPRWRRHMTNQLHDAVATLEHGGAHVGITLNPGFILPPGVGPLNEVYANAAHRWGLPTLDLGPIVNPNTRGYRWDGFHYTQAGADATGAELVGWIDRLRGETR